MATASPDKPATTQSITPEHAALAVALIATIILYFPVLTWLRSVWAQGPDYSHGYVVPLACIGILWVRRERFPQSTAEQPDSLHLIAAICVFVFALALRLLGIFTTVYTIEAVSIIPFLFAIVAICLGWKTAKWALPGLAFLVFMIPLPGFFGGQLGGLLQWIATKVSVFTLQTIGVPAISEGNIIHLSQGTIGVAEACSGLRMAYAFFALCIGACLITQRTWVERIILVVSAVPIAIAANCLRITATGIAYEYSDSETAEHIFHDLAGWLMVPTGLILLLGLMKLIDHILIIDRQPKQTARA